MHGLVRNKLERRCWHAREENVSFTDVKIKIPNRKVGQWMWMTSCTGSARGGFGGILKSQWVESCRPNKKGDFRLLAEALCRVRTWWWADGKVTIERWYLSPYVEKPLNSKVIKSFVPELRSRQVFFVFRDSYVIYEHFMNIICTFHIFMYGYVTKVHNFANSLLFSFSFFFFFCWLLQGLVV